MAASFPTIISPLLLEPTHGDERPKCNAPAKPDFEHAIRRADFKLLNGERIHLDSPPGYWAPYLHLAYMRQGLGVALRLGWTLNRSCLPSLIKPAFSSARCELTFSTSQNA